MDLEHWCWAGVIGAIVNQRQQHAWGCLWSHLAARGFSTGDWCCSVIYFLMRANGAYWQDPDTSQKVVEVLHVWFHQLLSKYDYLCSRELLHGRKSGVKGHWRADLQSKCHPWDSASHSRVNESFRKPWGRHGTPTQSIFINKSVIIKQTGQFSFYIVDLEMGRLKGNLAVCTNTCRQNEKRRESQSLQFQDKRQRWRFTERVVRH